MKLRAINKFRTCFQASTTGLAIALFCSGVCGPLAAEKADWLDDFDKGVKAAKRTGKPLLLDFYTDW